MHFKSVLHFENNFCNHYLNGKTFEEYEVQTIKAALLTRRAI